MKIPAINRSLFLLAVMTATSITLSAQSFLPQAQTGKTKPKQDTVNPALQPIPLAQINTATTEAFQLFARVRNTLLKPETQSEIEAEVQRARRDVQYFLNDSILADLGGLSFRQLENLNTSKQLLEQQVKDVLGKIRQHLEGTQQVTEKLATSGHRWQLTRQSITQQGSPEAIRKRVDNIITRSDSLNRLLQQDIDFLLTQSDQLTDQQIELEQLGMDLEKYRSLAGGKLLARDAAPIWVKFGNLEKGMLATQWKQYIKDIRQDTELLFSSYSGGVIGIVASFLFFLIVVFWIRGSLNEKNLKARAARFNLYLGEIFRMPLEVTLIITLYLAKIMVPELPVTYRTLLSVLAIYPIVRIAIDILPDQYRRHLIELTGAYLLIRLLNLIYDQSLVSRLLLLITQGLAIFFLLRFIIQNEILNRRKRSFVGNVLLITGGLFALFLGLSLIGNIIGIYGVSEYLASAIIQSSFLILTTYVGFHVSAALIYLLMRSRIAQRSNLIRDQFRYIFRKIYNLLRVLFVLSWVYIALYYFNARQSFVDGISGFLNREMSIGKVSLTLMSIVLFVFVIWLSMFIARVVRAVLQDEVFTRIEVKRGVPGTITMLVRIGLVTIGFLLAAAAAGMELSNLTIIIGAFSVGIGFGLQNIFNNLVSGLILVFERPIKEGDTVEVNNLLGEVKRIGIRSSVVRTYDGAEVIVPNGTLISNDLINWTLSDAHRRVDVRVGVAYGTDPEKVLALLLETGNESELAIREPEPKAFFLGFGDSSLDFRLLAWAELGNRLELESELKVTINRKLKEAGIEIPFPQRDLHIRSVDPKAGEDLGTRK